jgi:hypothetical protein
MNPVLQKKLSILIRLAGVDGDFAKIEKSFILNVCNENGVSNKECEDLIDNPDPIGSLGALSYNRVVEYMSECISLMLIDGKIRHSEVLLCEDIGLRLGFHKAAIDSVIEEVKADINTSRNNISLLVGSLPHHGKV